MLDRTRVLPDRFRQWFDGRSRYSYPMLLHVHRLIMHQVDGTAFNDTFNTPGPTIVGLIVAILEGRSSMLFANTGAEIH